MRVGILGRYGSLWIGIHYSPTNRRLCINLIPCITLWIVLPGGKVPSRQGSVFFWEVTDEIERTYWLSGQLKYEISYQNGQRHGVAKWWYGNGQLEHEVPYQNEQYHGVEKKWYENGRRQYECPYQNEQQHGTEKWWYEDGQLALKHSYQNGQLYGIAKQWDRNGQLECTIYWLYDNCVVITHFNNLWRPMTISSLRNLISKQPYYWVRSISP